MKNIKDFNSFIKESSDSIDEFEEIVKKSIELGPIRDDDEKSFRKYIEEYKSADGEKRHEIIKSFAEDLEWAYEDIYDKVSHSLNMMLGSHE